MPGHATPGTRTSAGRRRAAVRDEAVPIHSTEHRGLGFYGYVVRDVMTRKVAVADRDGTLTEAAQTMSTRHVSGLPVVDRDGRLVGILSQKDIIRVLHEKAGLSLPGGVFDLLLPPVRTTVPALTERCRETLDRTRVREAMTPRPLAVDTEVTVDEAIRLLVANRINRLPVVDGGRVVGIVTRHDLLTSVSSD